MDPESPTRGFHDERQRFLPEADSLAQQVSPPNRINNGRPRRPLPSISVAAARHPSAGEPLQKNHSQNLQVPDQFRFGRVVSAESNYSASSVYSSEPSQTSEQNGVIDFAHLRSASSSGNNRTPSVPGDSSQRLASVSSDVPESTLGLVFNDDSSMEPRDSASQTGRSDGTSSFGPRNLNFQQSLQAPAESERFSDRTLASAKQKQLYDLLGIESPKLKKRKPSPTSAHHERVPSWSSALGNRADVLMNRISSPSDLESGSSLTLSTEADNTQRSADNERFLKQQNGSSFTRVNTPSVNSEQDDTPRMSNKALAAPRGLPSRPMTPAYSHGSDASQSTFSAVDESYATAVPVGRSAASPGPHNRRPDPNGVTSAHSNGSSSTLLPPDYSSPTTKPLLLAKKRTSPPQSFANLSPRQSPRSYRALPTPGTLDYPGGRNSPMPGGFVSKPNSPRPMPAPLPPPPQNNAFMSPTHEQYSPHGYFPPHPGSFLGQPGGPAPGVWPGHPAQHPGFSPRQPVITQGGPHIYPHPDYGNSIGNMMMQSPSSMDSRAWRQSPPWQEQRPLVPDRRTPPMDIGYYFPESMTGGWSPSFDSKSLASSKYQPMYSEKGASFYEDVEDRGFSPQMLREKKHLYPWWQRAIYDPSPPSVQRAFRAHNVGIQRFAWLTYLICLGLVGVMVWQLIHAWKSSGSPIAIKPNFNYLVGPSGMVLINEGARFPACMKNIDSLANQTWSCLDGKGHCSLSQICGFGAENDNPQQSFRFMMPIVLHAGVVHLIVNIVCLALSAAYMEKLMGSIRYLILFATAGIFGNVLGANFALVGQPSVGASGAIFGIYAASLVDLVAHWSLIDHRIRQLFFLIVEIVVSLGIGWAPGVDNFCHIGGFASGLLASLILVPLAHASKTHRIVATIARVVALAGLVLMFVLLIRNFYTSNPYKSCEWCRYLSCWPTDANQHCKGTGLEVQ